MKADENQHTTIRIKKSTKKNLELLKGMLTLKYPDQAPFTLDDTIELTEREYFGIMINKNPEMKKLLKLD